MLSIDLDGQVALVTGSVRGIGRSVAEKLLEAGCHVVLNGRSASKSAADSVNELERLFPGRVDVLYGSVEDSGFAKSVASHIAETYGKLDILVNNAGILKDNLIGMIPDSDIIDVYQVNVVGVINFTQIAARLMAPAGCGSIVNLSSIIGRYGNFGQLVYGSSKAAVIGVTQSSAKELASTGIRVNAVAPGLIKTDMISNIPEAMRAKIQGNIALERIGLADDVADVVLYLTSDLSRYVTGQVVGVDGGLVI